MILREKNNEVNLAAESRQLELERSKASELQSHLSQIELELSVCKEQRTSEVSELESRLKAETEKARNSQASLSETIRVSQFMEILCLGLTFLEFGISSGTF